MNQSLDGYSLHPSVTLPKASLALEAILTFLRSIQADNSQAVAFSKAFEVVDFQMGDDLADYVSATPAENSVHFEQRERFYHIICSGRVRLLGFDPQQQRQVSALVLEAGETFGGEHLFSHQIGLTKAIAASAGIVARISISELKRWLERLPLLGEYLRQLSQQRQCLVFFKTATELRSLSSHQLRQLLPLLAEKQIDRGESIVEATPPGTGRFWLCSGQIQSHNGASPPPTVGQSWGEPGETPPDWIAETDILAYQLTLENWSEALSIAPMLPVFTKSANSLVDSNGNGHKKRATAARNSSLPIQLVDRRRQPQPEQKVPFAEPEPTKIDFPTPVIQVIGKSFWQALPYIQQQSSSDCGAACLAMVSKYWGKSFSINTLRNLAEVDRSGASLKGVAKAAENLGFHARPVRASLSKLESLTNPWIAHWEGNHYIVVYQVKGDRVLVADPAISKKWLTRQQFLDGWTGYALLLDPTQRLQETPSEKVTLGQFWGAVLPYRSLIWQIVGMSVLIQVFGLLTPMFTQIILDQVVVQKSFVTLNVFALGLLLFSIWRIGLTATRQYMLDYFSNRFDLTLISGFINHTLLLPLKFFESRRVGDIITRVQENRKVQVFITRQAILAWLDALTAIVYIGLMFYYNWQLAFLVIGLIPPIALLTLIATPMLRKVSRESFNTAAAENSLLVEMLTGVATVKAAAAERELRWRWEDRFTSALNAQFRGQKLANGLQATGGLIYTLGTTALLWYGANLVIKDQLSIGQFVAFNMMIGNVINPVLSVVNLWDELQEVMISVERLNDVFTSPTEEPPGQPMLILPQVRGEVRLENVTFKYNPDAERNTLQNISFNATVGQTVAIVGRSGSGKSTLVSLLQGLYHPTSGRILIDGHDVRHISPQSLRIQLGVVPQECFLFSGTILENITLYRSNFTLEQVTEVAKLAEAHAFIQDMPLGYNTQVGERGTSLSGGQRQRIAIARALLGDPRILVLDEATSSLDTESERRFQQNLQRICRDRTTFIIAHRLSTVRHADCILVLDRGILAEVGTHEQLMALQGIYYHLAQQQLDL